MENPSNFSATALFIAVVIVMFLLVVNGLAQGLSGMAGTGAKGKAMLRTGVILGIWLLASAGMAWSGFLQNFEALPPRFVFLVVPPLAGMLIFTFSRLGARLLDSLPPQWFIYLQTFRVFVEVVLWLLFLQKLVPVQMTFEGRNWDILVGLTAPIAGLYLARNPQARKTGIVWNLFGLGLVLNIVVVSVLSAPSPFRVFMNEPANTIVAYFPYMWLPGFLVPIAIVLHVLSLKQLLRSVPTQVAAQPGRQPAAVG